MKDNNKKIAIYGGAFDPPHYGHVFGVWALLNSNYFDEIWIVPSGDRADKPDATSSGLRLKMLNVLIKENFDAKNSVIVKDFQINNVAVPKTSYELFKYLSDSYKCTDFYCAIGAELVSELSSWKDSQQLLKTVNFVIIPRLKIVPDISKIKNCKILNTPKDLEFNISSSVIRNLVKEGKDISGIIPNSVKELLLSNNLYKS